MSSDVVTCENCKAYAAECETPVGDGAASLCWLCAHDITFHGLPLGELREGPCGCARHQVYPAAVLAKLDADLEAAKRYRVRPEFIGRDSQRIERVRRVLLHRTGEYPAGN